LKLKTRTTKWTQTAILRKFRQAIAVQARTLYNVRFDDDDSLSVLSFACQLQKEMELDILNCQNDVDRRTRSSSSSPSRGRRRMSTSPLRMPVPKRKRRADEVTTLSDVGNHWPCRTEKAKGISCRCKVCYNGFNKQTTSTSFFCQKCEVFLCIPHANSQERDCFRLYHEDPGRYRAKQTK
jgi:DDE_Tnp_1-like zinc-ribbon